MHILCSDLEGVFVPEIWINVAQKTGVEELKLTTRDISDYDVLMGKRLSVMAAHKLKLPDIQAVIQEMEPLEGAFEFLEWIRERYQIIIVSDTFVEFAGPLMKKLNWPTLFCNSLIVSDDGRVTGYKLRQNDGKRKTTLALKSLNYTVVAFGDSYNDISMLKEADAAFLFRPPENVTEEFPEIPFTRTYDGLKTLIKEATAE
ncbi:MAG TPA: bifunctional phosphoserine phosphatase/homoserine phosphotransferase ThrH [Desulfosalsimonadaceae bacterium]|nr:bifunctional phosphoserine phosphatase/homoserine phosphotransferase ThrH [Desulfosalsimonadaceae bacterium]